jgi:hypothetical protein
MAIVVGHGGGFGNAGALIASAIGRDKDRANQRAMQMRELKVRGAIASTQAQMQYEASHEANQTALAKTAIQAGLQKDSSLPNSEYRTPSCNPHESLSRTIPLWTTMKGSVR